MSEKIRVKVVNAGGANLRLRYVDPTTGRVVTSTKYVDPVSSEITRTGKIRKFARKLAAVLEADHNAGRSGPGSRLAGKIFAAGTKWNFYQRCPLVW
jgi:hypothetical protein